MRLRRSFWPSMIGAHVPSSVAGIVVTFDCFSLIHAISVSIAGPCFHGDNARCR